MGLAFDQLFGKVSVGHRRRRPHRGAYTATDGVGTSRGPDRRRRPRPGRTRSTASAPPRARSAATRCSPTTTARPSSPAAAPRPWATACPPTRASAGTSTLLTGQAPDGPHEVAIDATSAEENDIALGSTIKVLLPGSDRRSSPSSAPSASAARRTSAAPRRRTSTPRPHSEVLGTPGAVRHDRRERGRRVSARPSSPSGWPPWCPDGTEAVTGADRGRGELRRGQGGPQDRRASCS